MHIAIFNQHHHNPDCPATCRHYSFMQELAKRHQVTLISSNGWKSIRLTDKYSWVPEGVKLLEQRVPYANKMGVGQRLKSFSRFAAFSFRQGMLMPKPDVIWAVSTPLSTPWVAAKVAKLRHVPLVFEIQDLWPSFPIEMGAVRSKYLKKLLYQTEKRLYQGATELITLSPDMTAYVEGLGIRSSKISTILNGTDFEYVDAISSSELNELHSKYQLGNKKVVLYAGTYGRANDIPGLMQAIKSLSAEPDIKFVVTGSGYYEPQLKELAGQVPNLLLLPPQPRHEVFKLFKLAELSLVTFNDLPVLASNSPSKFYDSLACGTPVIVTNPGWTKCFVEEYNVGWYTPAEEPVALATCIKEVLNQPDELKVAGAKGQAIARKKFDRQVLVNDVEQVLLKAAKL